MGFLTPIDDEAAIDAAVRIVDLRAEGSSRSCVIQFRNHTDRPLRLVANDPWHGVFEEHPSFEIPPQTADVFSSVSSGFATGAAGTVTYSIGELSAGATVWWRNPYIGSNSCSGGSSGERAAAFAVDSLRGSGNNAHMTFSLHQVLDPRLVRSPDYRFVRLEGFAFDPDDPLHVPNGVLELHSWWSHDNEDNWATTDPTFTGPVLKFPVGAGERPADRERSGFDFSTYRHVRFEGFAFPDPKPDDVDVVPLHSWWSLGRKDNFTSTNPDDTSPLRERLEFADASYEHRGFQGWIFPPDRPQPPHTVPLNSWYSPRRHDNFVTSDPRWRP